ncbi:MAG: CDP-alcohol phosphatidyltransferase family protein [Clostridia bacterium]|nr:CDP-alcohol phosphatidyltransferase family protein [Clostridia bacterium]
MNTPNKLSLLRIILVPILMFFYLATFIPGGKLIAFVLFIVAAITDRFDGKIARRDGIVTDLGKLLDPIADKMLITCGLFLIVFDFDGAGAIAHPWGIIALFIMFSRDCIVNGVRQLTAQKGVAFAAVKSGKLKAIFAYSYIPTFMFLAQIHIWQQTFLADIAFVNILVIIITVAAYILLALGTIVTAYSAYDYIRKALPIMGTEAKNSPLADKLESGAKVDQKSIQKADSEEKHED